MNIKFSNEVLYPKKPFNHKLGNVYLVGYEEGDLDYVLLSQVCGGEVSLIGLHSYSNRWVDAINVKNVWNITDKEFEDITACDYCKYVGRIEDIMTKAGLNNER